MNIQLPFQGFYQTALSAQIEELDEDNLLHGNHPYWQEVAKIYVKAFNKRFSTDLKFVELWSSPPDSIITVEITRAEFKRIWREVPERKLALAFRDNEAGKIPKNPEQWLENPWTSKLLLQTWCDMKDPEGDLEGWEVWIVDDMNEALSEAMPNE